MEPECVSIPKGYSDDDPSPVSISIRSYRTMRLFGLSGLPIDLPDAKPVKSMKTQALDLWYVGMASDGSFVQTKSSRSRLEHGMILHPPFAVEQMRIVGSNGKHNVLTLGYEVSICPTCSSYMGVTYSIRLATSV
jgi:hypothetical protein